jgi:hypothetical protein
MLSFDQIIKLVFHNVYLQNDGQKLFLNTEDSHLNRFAAFIEIPNWREKTGETETVTLFNKKTAERALLKSQTWRNLGKKFIGWQDNVGLAKKILNVFLAVFFFVPINLATVLIRTPINIIRLFTEFLPMLAFTATFAKLYDIKNEKNKSFGTIAWAIALGLVNVVTYLLALASHSFTNPLSNFVNAWNYGRHQPLITHPVLQVLLGATLAAISLSFTFIGYTLFASIPLIQTAAAAFLHAAALAVPQVIAALSGVGVIAAKAVSTLLWFMPVAGQFLTSAAAATPALLGVAALTALIMPTLGNLLDPIIERFKENWYSPTISKTRVYNPFSDDAHELSPRPSSYAKMHRSGLKMSSGESDHQPATTLAVASPAVEAPYHAENEELAPGRSLRPF